MCGIAGIYGFNGPSEELDRCLQVMNDAMLHRGPDEEGMHVEPGMRSGLAVRRLSIVDPEHGSQPLYNEDRSIAVVCNGEIYNHRALRRELERKGHRLGSRSDCEVLAHLYEEEGVDCLQRLNGMFALAILDTRNRRLVLARDPVGMKHLYWTETPNGIVFASEARSLFAAGLVKPRPDWSELGAYFTVGWVQSPGTAFEGLKRLRQGSFVVASGSGIREGRYWIPRYRDPEHGRSGQDYADELKGLLEGAVETHLEADFPAGVYLSGGWDSSLITLYASRRQNRPLKSYSLVFPEDPGSDESHYFRQVVEQAGTESLEIEVRDADLRDALVETADALEEPNGSCPTTLGLLLSEPTRRTSKLVLGGEGADELFGGYDWFKPSRLQGLLRMVPHQLVPDSLPIPLGPRMDRALRFLAAPDDELAQLSLRSASSPGQVARLLNPDYSLDTRPRAGLTGLTDETRETFRDPVDRKLALDFTGRLPDGILLAHDKTSMAHSIEVRMPFLDREVVEFAHRLPSRFKIRDGLMKAVLAPLARELPHDVATRPKQGLHVPDRMIGAGTLQAFYAETILETSLSTHLFDHRRLEQWVGKAMSGSGHRASRLRSLCHFCLWWNLFIERTDWT